MNEELAHALIYEEDHEDFDHFTLVEGPTLTDTSRWSVMYESIYKDDRDGSFWRVDWDEGATEYQESSGDVGVVRVYPKEVTVTKYTTVAE